MIRVAMVGILLAVKGAMAVEGKKIDPVELGKLAVFEQSFIRSFSAGGAGCATPIAQESAQAAEERQRLERARQTVLASPSVVDLLRVAIRNSKLSAVALEMVESITPAQMGELLEEILPFALHYGHPSQERIARVIEKRIPRATVTQHLEPMMMTFLSRSDAESGEWEEAILFSQRVQPELIPKLVKAALASDDEEVRAIGNRYSP